ncbi:MAG TPA: SRPBCC family protein [Steroidobacteraceae bacterium]
MSRDSAAPAWMLVGLLLLPLPAARAAAPDWPLSAAQHARLAAGEVLVDAAFSGESPEGFIRAAVLVHALNALVFRTMTDCDKALKYVPHLVACKVLETTPDGRSQVIAHEADYSWYLPRTRYVFRADYEPGERVRFKAVSGDFRVNQGMWELVPQPATGSTLVTYRVLLQPRFFAPRWLVRASLKRELPDLMRALRDYCEREAREATALQLRPAPQADAQLPRSSPQRAPRQDYSAPRDGGLRNAASLRPSVPARRVPRAPRFLFARRLTGSSNAPI